MKHELKCKNCKRHLGWSVGTTIVEGLICPLTKCKYRNNFKIVTPDSTPEQINYKFESTK